MWRVAGLVIVDRTAKRTIGTAAIDPRFVPVIDAFVEDRHVSKGKMMSSYCLKVNGRIFAMFGKCGFVVKLPKKRVDELVGGGKGERFEAGRGRIMKEWIAIGAGKANWIELAREAYQFVKQG